MSGFLNRASLIGNLGQAPEVRTTQAGKKIVTLSIATTESWKDVNSGERVERTEWHRVVIFNEGLALLAEKYLTKGAKVFIEGKLSTRKWTDNDGNERYSTEIQLSPYNGTLTFLSKKPSDRGDDDNGPVTARQRVGAGAGHSALGADLSDDIPF